MSIDDLGILQTIWLYRKHTKLRLLLQHVQRPTTDNLRKAGKVAIRLVGRPSSNREMSKAEPLGRGETQDDKR
jgi:hypothetical protein